METQLINRYAVNMNGVLACYDRILIVGTLPGACYAGGMFSLLFSKGIRIFDYAKFAEPLRERIRDCAQEVCKAAGVEIEHVNKVLSARKTWWHRCWKNVVMPRVWCMSCRP